MQGEAPHSTVFGYCDGTGTQWGCPRGTRAFTLVEFDLSSLNKDAEVCMASLSMVRPAHCSTKNARFPPFFRRSFALSGFLAPRRRERAKNGGKWAKFGGETGEKQRWL